MAFLFTICGRLLFKGQFIAVCFDSDGLLVVYLSTDDALGKFVEKLVLNGALDRTCSELWVESCTGNETDGVVRDLERDAVLSDHLGDLVDLQTDYLLNLGLVERREGDDVVDSVEELGNGRCS